MEAFAQCDAGARDLSHNACPNSTGILPKCTYQTRLVSPFALPHVRYVCRHAQPYQTSQYCLIPSHRSARLSSDVRQTPSTGIPSACMLIADPAGKGKKVILRSLTLYHRSHSFSRFETKQHQDWWWRSSVLSCYYRPREGKGKS